VLTLLNPALTAVAARFASEFNEFFLICIKIDWFSGCTQQI
jgi:hypothetical protein